MKNISIVITSIARDSLLRAVRSIYAQEYDGNIQLCIGIDVDAYGNADKFKQIILSECPKNCSVLWMNLGYSTSTRHGGVHGCHFGGSLRTALTLLAKYKRVMFLDDDDWLTPNHCSAMIDAMENTKSTWVYPVCMYADSVTATGICVDEIESVGPGKGIYAEKFGGFVRPSGMLFDKLQVLHLIHLLSMSPYATGDGEDRLFFKTLKDLPSACSNVPSVYYSLDPNDSMHEYRMQYMKHRGIEYVFDQKPQSVRVVAA